MKKVLLKIQSIILIILLSVGIFSFSKVRAAANISVSSSNVGVGDGASISISVYAMTSTIYVSGAASGNLVGGELGGENKTFSTTIPIDTSSAGQKTVTISGDYTTADGDNVTVNETRTITVHEKESEEPASSGDDSSGSSSSGTTAEEGSAPTEKPKEETDENKSNNNSLASITLSEGSLTPAFYRDVLDYSVEFPEDFNLRALKSIHVDAKAEDGNATVEGTGEVTLDEGENVIKITCTAENGTPKTYSLKIVKPLALKVSDLRLTKLELSSINTKGDAKPIDLKLENDKFEYKVEVEDDITDINVVTEAEKGIRISTKGGKNLSNGSNLIEITLTSEADETVQTSYVIRVVKKEKASGAKVDEEKINKKNKIITWILFGFIIALIVATIVLLIILKKKKKDTIEYKKNKVKFADDDDFNGDDFRNDIFKDQESLEEDESEESDIEDTQKVVLDDAKTDDGEVHTKEEWAKILNGEELPEKEEVKEEKVEEDILDKELDEEDIMRNAEKSKAILDEYLRKHGRPVSDEPKPEVKPEIEEKVEDESSKLFNIDKDEDEFDISKLERPDTNAVIKDMTEEDIPESLRADNEEKDELSDFEQNPEIDKILKDESTYENIEDAHVSEKDMIKKAKEEMEKDKYYHSDLDKKLREDDSKDKKDKGRGGRRFK